MRTDIRLAPYHGCVPQTGFVETAIDYVLDFYDCVSCPISGGLGLHIKFVKGDPPFRKGELIVEYEMADEDTMSLQDWRKSTDAERRFMFKLPRGFAWFPPPGHDMSFLDTSCYKGRGSVALQANILIRFTLREGVRYAQVVAAKLLEPDPSVDRLHLVANFRYGHDIIHYSATLYVCRLDRQSASRNWYEHNRFEFQLHDSPSFYHYDCNRRARVKSLRWKHPERGVVQINSIDGCELDAESDKWQLEVYGDEGKCVKTWAIAVIYAEYSPHDVNDCTGLGFYAVELIPGKRGKAMVGPVGVYSCSDKMDKVHTHTHAHTHAHTTHTRRQTHTHTHTHRLLRGFPPTPSEG